MVNHEKTHLAHPQAELGFQVSHMPSAELEPTPDKAVRRSSDKETALLTARPWGAPMEKITHHIDLHRRPFREDKSKMLHLLQSLKDGTRLAREQSKFIDKVEKDESDKQTEAKYVQMNTEKCKQVIGWCIIYSSKNSKGQCIISNKL